MSVENIVSTIKNELQALKTASPLSIGALRFPSTTPTQTYSGNLDTSLQQLVIGRFVATFTRSDSGTAAPYVDFGFSASISPTQAESMAQQGTTITGNDLTPYEDVFINGYVSATSTNSVSFTIDVKNAVQPYANPVTINLTVQAYSTVSGTLTLTRTI